MCHPSALRGPDTGTWISDADGLEIPHAASASPPKRSRPTGGAPRHGRPIPRCTVPGPAVSPFLTDTRLPIEHADVTHRQHTIIETVFAELIDGPLAHIPSGRYGANSTRILCAAIAHDLLRAAGTLAGNHHTRAHGSTLRRKIVNVPGRRNPDADDSCTCPLAPVEGLTCAMAQPHRIKARHHLWQPDPPIERPNRNAGQTSNLARAYGATIKITRPRNQSH